MVNILFLLEQSFKCLLNPKTTWRKYSLPQAPKKAAAGTKLLNSSDH